MQPQVQPGVIRLEPPWRLIPRLGPTRQEFAATSPQHIQAAGLQAGRVSGCQRQVPNRPGRSARVPAGRRHHLPGQTRGKH